MCFIDKVSSCNYPSDPQEFQSPPKQFQDPIYVSDVIQKEGLKYIAGYAASRFRNKYSFLGTPTKLLTNSDEDWIHYISKGGMISPSTELIETGRNNEFGI